MLKRSPKMKTLLPTLIPLLVVSCSSTNVSDVKPFDSVAGKVVTTRRICYLKPLNEGLFFGDGISFLRRPSFELTLREPETSHEILSEGTQLEIDSIIDETLIDGNSQVAYGTVDIDGQSKADFAYRWGFLSSLERAPWETSQVPGRRN